MNSLEQVNDKHVSALKHAIAMLPEDLLIDVITTSINKRYLSIHGTYMLLSALDAIHQDKIRSAEDAD